MQHWLDDSPQPRQSQQREADGNSTNYRAHQGETDDNPAQIDIEHVTPQTEKPFNHSRDNS